MKKFKLSLVAIFLLLLTIFGFKTYRDFNISKELKREEKNRLKKSAEILNNCFDLKNKSKRTMKESMDLIEYCLNNYGTKK